MPPSLPNVVRAIAVVEAIKGLLARALGFGPLRLVHRNVQSVAEEILRLSPFDPAGRCPRIVLAAAGSVTDLQRAAAPRACADFRARPRAASSGNSA